MKFMYRTDRNARAISAFWGKPLDNKESYSIKSLSDNEVELFVFDVLGWPFNDINGMIKEIAMMKKKKMMVRLNSPGGDPIDTFALYHALKNHDSEVTIRIEALAASAASFLALAGSEVQAYPSSLMMIHNCWVMAVGNRFELADTCDLLEKIDDNMQEIYSKKTKKGKKEMQEMMKCETWMNAKEMKEQGFIDTILDGKAVKAEFDLSMFANIPDTFGIDNTTEPAIRKYEKALRDVGASKNEARTILARGLKSANAATEFDNDARELVTQLTIASELRKLTANMLS